MLLSEVSIVITAYPKKQAISMNQDGRSMHVTYNCHLVGWVAKTNGCFKHNVLMKDGFVRHFSVVTF